RQAIALARQRIALESSPRAEPGRQLPLPGDLLDARPRGVALGEHSVARSLRLVALGAGLVAFTRALRRQAGRRSLALDLGTQVLDAQLHLRLDRRAPPGDRRLPLGERLTMLAAQLLTLALGRLELVQRLIT